jgi:hypothetical protein
MKRLLLLGLVGVLAFSAPAFSQTTVLWQKTAAASSLPSWFATNNTQRNLAYADIGGNGHLYVTKAGGLSPIMILDASTGDSIGTLNETGISGGTFDLDDIESSTNGVIFAGNLTINAKTSPFKVYEWTSESATPKAVISYSDSSYRLGDHFTVTGSTVDNSVAVWVAATNGSAVVKFTTTDNGATFTPTVIKLDSVIGSVPKVAPLPNGDFFISSGGKGIEEFDSTGKFIGSVASMPSSLGSMAYISGGSPAKSYVFGYDYTNTVGAPPQYVQVTDITKGITSADSVSATPILGTTLNANGTGDIAVTDDGDGTVTMYVLSTNNGIGAYKFTAWQLPQLPGAMPAVWQDSRATNNLPSWFNTSNEERNMAYGTVGGKEHLYLTYGGPSLAPVLILDAATGDSVGTLDTTGISGGVFPLNGIGVSTDGMIFASNLTVNAKTTPFRIYEWTSETAVPRLVATFADSAYRLGDHITVTGSASDNSVTVWVAATSGSALVKFTTTNNGAAFTPTVIPLTSSVGSTPKVSLTGNGDIFISSAGDGIKEYDSTGKYLGTVTAMPITLGSMAYIAGGFPMKAYVFGYDYTNITGITPQFVEAEDVTNGISSADSVGATPVLGTALNANGTGDIAVKDNGDGTLTIYVLATNNGIGAFTFNAWQPAPPAVRQTMPVLWQKTAATSSLPSWFATNNTQRNFAYADIGGSGHLYVTKAGGLSPIMILDASTGDSIGTLNETGISGGTFELDDIESSTNGVIFAGNLTINAKTSPFKVYEWTSESATPKAVISYSDSSYRLGDHFTVTGSTVDNSVAVWVAATNGSAVVKFTTTDNGATFTPTVIKLDSVIGSVPKVAPLGNGDFFISSGGKGIEEFDSTGKVIGSVASMPSSLGSMAYISGGSPAKSYVFGYDYTNTVGAPPQYVQVTDITKGITSADSVSATPVLGTTLNANGTGDIAVKENSDGSLTVFVLSTNNGIGAYTFAAQLTAIKQEKNLVPDSYDLSQNYPNPFNPTTQISYSIPKNSCVTLKVYNVLGQEVATLFAGERSAGTYTTTFNASRFASGVYFYRLSAGSFVSIKKMVLIK